MAGAGSIAIMRMAAAGQLKRKNLAHPGSSSSGRDVVKPLVDVAASDSRSSVIAITSTSSTSVRAHSPAFGVSRSPSVGGARCSRLASVTRQLAGRASNNHHCPPTGYAAAVSDLCIDGDGFATPLPGAFEVQIGDVLTAFPTAFHAGLDLFDRPPLGVLTQDDDLHAEDPTVCPGAVRNAVHDPSDCDVLDINGDLANGTPVTCDVETGGCNAFLIKFQDKNGNGLYDPQLGEDLVRDTNNNNVFD